MFAMSGLDSTDSWQAAQAGAPPPVSTSLEVEDVGSMAPKRPSSIEKQQHQQRQQQHQQQSPAPPQILQRSSGPPPRRERQQNSSEDAANTISASLAHPPPLPLPLPTDSLSLAQLRKIVSEVNRPPEQQRTYDYVYVDVGPLADEVDEWFTHQFWQWVRLSSAQKAFEWHWGRDEEEGEEEGWEVAGEDLRRKFVAEAVGGVREGDATLRAAAIGRLAYLVLGRWGDTAVPEDEIEGDGGDGVDRGDRGRTVASLGQLRAIKDGVECLASVDGLSVVWEALTRALEFHWSGEFQNTATSGQNPQEPQDELMNLMTIIYISVQQALNDPENTPALCDKLLELQPPLVEFMLTATVKLRWDEHNSLPQAQSILFVFGGSNDLERVKKATSEMNENQDKEKITASPLDYHVFRQEIISKYPAYIPPQPTLPLEDDNTSLLPPLSQHPARNNGSNGILPAPPSAAHTGGASILHQPVHIATPAPSPPPSPGAGGKVSKKQNYQTNQNFPFMYPPLDATSNSAGGKGPAALDGTINRRWEGSDIPASILEAGELFSTRVRMTRATRQLWEEREAFLKSERGWDDGGEEGGNAGDEDDDIEELDLTELTEEDKELLREVKGVGKERRKSVVMAAPPDEPVDFGPRPHELGERDKKRLIAVESFYHQALPHLQSLVIVLLRPAFATVAAIVQQQGPMMQGMPGRGPNVNGGGGSGGPPGVGDQGRAGIEVSELSPEEMEAARTREIMTKAMSGTLIMLLKWLRLSHVLRFEYFTQLLLDSNYIPLVLKLLAHQDVQKVVESKTDRPENSFFHFCNLRCRFKGKTDSNLDEEEEEKEQGEGGIEGGHVVDEVVQEADADAEESDDSAAPPPIKRHRSPPSLSSAVEMASKEGEEEAEVAVIDSAAMNRDDEGQEQDSGVLQKAADEEKEEAGGKSTARNEEMDDLAVVEEYLAMMRVKEAAKAEAEAAAAAAAAAAEAELNSRPITDFSRRNFFSLINYLRIMHKVCKGKAHRNLLLVQFKSSTILRRSLLRVPQHTRPTAEADAADKDETADSGSTDLVRLYTLKLFKNQVPYCGRKWRQGNMRVITAVYLFCRPALRDEWLAGSDVDADVDAALPLEQALRALTHWFNLRRYPDKVVWWTSSSSSSAQQQQQQQDFFARELERLDVMDWAEVAGEEADLSESERW